MRRVVDVVGALVGLPQTNKRVIKYCLPRLPNLSELPVKCEIFQVRLPDVLSNRFCVIVLVCRKPRACCG